LEGRHIDITNIKYPLQKHIIKRIAKHVDQHLREEQAGFREGRGTTEQIFTLRNIIEQTVEWNSNLNICVIELEKTFYSVHLDTQWENHENLWFS
jgi:sorting nexin-29